MLQQPPHEWSYRNNNATNNETKKDKTTNDDNMTDDAMQDDATKDEVYDPAILQAVSESEYNDSHILSLACVIDRDTRWRC